MSRFESVALRSNSALESFTPEQKKVINERLQILSSLVYLIGRDYDIGIEVNTEEGWHWDFKNNVVRADAKDLLTKPIEFLRFVISHEAGHRRISRVFDVIPEEVWHQPGFAFMMNAIEDPRDNNFVADLVPKFRDEMSFAYGTESEVAQFETEMRGEANKRFGEKPRFMQAGFEYIRLWYQISLGEEPVVREDLPEDVKDVVVRTLPAARRSWNTYPSQEEAENGVDFAGKKLSGEETITEYARESFNINFNEIWPLFKTLIDKDIEDQKDRNGKEEVKSTLTSEEVESLFKEFADLLARGLQGEFDKAKGGELNDKEVFQRSEYDVDGVEAAVASTALSAEDAEKQKVDFAASDQIINDLIMALEKRNRKDTKHEEVLKELGPLIDQLTFELQEIFNKRKHVGWRSGFKSGKRISVGQAIQEEVRGASPFETGAFMRREQPLETDYVIDLLVDLSGSMSAYGKVGEAYKAVVILAEAMNNIGIKFAVSGFNLTLHNFKSYESELSDLERKGFERMLGEVYTTNSRGNNDGWALDNISKRILAQEESKKIIFIISDGQPAPSLELSHYDLGEVVADAAVKGVKIIGLGLGSDTDHVEHYYPNSVSNITVSDLAKVLTQKVREAIEGG